MVGALIVGMEVVQVDLMIYTTSWMFNVHAMSLWNQLYELTQSQKRGKVDIKDKTKTQHGQTRNLTKNKIWMILLLEQNMMQFKHEMN
jgi:hypothetical protein